MVCPCWWHFFHSGTCFQWQTQDSNKTHAEVPSVCLAWLWFFLATSFHVDPQTGAGTTSIAAAAPAPGGSEAGGRASMGRVCSFFATKRSRPTPTPGLGSPSRRAPGSGKVPAGNPGGGAGRPPGAVRCSGLPGGAAGRAVPAPLGPAAPCGSASVNQPDFTPARPVFPVLYPRRLLVSLLRCEPGARPPLPLRLQLGECAGGGARGSAERRGAAWRGAERGCLLARPGCGRRGARTAAGSPGAGPRVGPGPPRWTLRRASPASCSAARSPCPPAPCGAPGTEVGLHRAAAAAPPPLGCSPCPAAGVFAARPSEVATRRPAAFRSP